MGNNKRRSVGQEFLLYDDDMSRGWRVNRRISFKAGERLELAGRAVRVVDEITGQHLGWQLATKQQPVNPGREILSDATPFMMNVWEMELVAGVYGRSRTLGLPMNDERRLIRVDKNGYAQSPEDDIERAIEKLKLIRHREVRKREELRIPRRERRCADPKLQATGGVLASSR